MYDSTLPRHRFVRSPQKRNLLTYPLNLGALLLVSLPKSEYLASMFHKMYNIAVTWMQRLSLPPRNLVCSTGREGISPQPIGCNYIRLKFGLTWNTVHTFGLEHPNTSSFRWTASNAERFVSTATWFFPIDLIHWLCGGILRLSAFFTAFITGSVLRNFLDYFRQLSFIITQRVKNSNFTNTIWMNGNLQLYVSLGISYLVQCEYGISCHRMYFRTDTT